MMNKKLLALIQSGNTHKFYKSKEWLHKRKEILRRDHNECQKCKEKGKFHLAECIHHRKHLREYPLLALTDSNLTSLCNACHNEEHPEKFKRFKSSNKKKFTNTEKW